MKLGEYTPKYRTIELIVMNRIGIPTLRMVDIDTAKKEFGNFEIRSVRDYDRTKKTSIIIERRNNHPYRDEGRL